MSHSKKLIIIIEAMIFKRFLLHRKKPELSVKTKIETLFLNIYASLGYDILRWWLHYMIPVSRDEILSRFAGIPAVL